jgi:23S rRNA-/tRNA-specific pseudouridylate synthase
MLQRRLAARSVNNLRTLRCAMQDWQAAQQQSPVDVACIRQQLHTLQRKQAASQERALELAFRQRDAAGQRIQQKPAQFAHALGVPVDRAERLLQAAIKATPLPADSGPVDVLFEDEHLIAVNKPPGLRSHPIHRHVGGSVLNRLIHYLGYPPRVCSHAVPFPSHLLGCLTAVQYRLVHAKLQVCAKLRYFAIHA